ncbi:Hypothetical protein NAEGRDRAFT_74638 [Naegleria gruberi]|uniref:F-box domain-containing protein n=1 Tax=Naegleria gruberi TaxID=5762 RepID=D2VZW1_NAEGR|nr:uncharacterized protein NAEGRDRAFT_74638 [Naegleria gruberi]EFC37598.1 Hypothetical protein NAEGRDRAFT_74638 [Naegleria gruberi]|eukprot:XP_002670342.1 Hypothetical protein NAEGRDRAFT_74638 [Naegleria gruberi strain NEG-M]
MGNVQEPAKPATKFDNLLEDCPHPKGCLASFMKTVPVEVKLHTFSYVPMKDLPNLLLISKRLKNSILGFDNLFEIYYSEFRKTAFDERKQLSRGRWNYDLDESYYPQIIPENMKEIQTK